MAGSHQNDARNRIHNPQTQLKSLRHRLLIRIAIVLIITWFIAAIFTKFSARDSTRDFLQRQTQFLANQWITLVSQPSFSSIDTLTPSTSLLLGWRNDTIVLQQGPFNLPRPENLNDNGETTTITVDDFQWVVTKYCQEHSCVIIGFKDTERRYAVRRLVAAIFLPLLVVFSFAMIAMYYAVRSGLYPLNQLTQRVSAVSPDKLSPVPEENSTKELFPLIKALNQLIANIQEQLIKERQFLDTCTHELRTPVTALVAQIQTVDFVDSKVKKQLENIRITASRTIRVANQFLTLAKNKNSEALEHQEETFDLCELIRQISSDLLVHHENCECTMKGLNKLEVTADALALEMVFRNLIDNALRHGITKQRTLKIIITCKKDKNDSVTICVEDSGPGIAIEYHQKILQRFYRIPGTSTDGAGLGLNIVNEVAKRYQGHTALSHSEQLHGLKVMVSFKGIAKDPKNEIL